MLLWALGENKEIHLVQVVQYLHHKQGQIGHRCMSWVGQHLQCCLKLVISPKVGQIPKSWSVKKSHKLQIRRTLTYVFQVKITYIVTETSNKTRGGVSHIKYAGNIFISFSLYMVGLQNIWATTVIRSHQSKVIR